MSMTAHIHRATKVEAQSAGQGTYWISFEDEAKDNRAIIFCDNFEVAKATADAFNDAMAYSGAKDEADHEPA